MTEEIILVTGGTGFIGRWAVAKLTELGHTAWVLARRAEQRSQEYEQWIEQHGGNPRRVKLIESDLDKPSLGLTEQAQAQLEDVTLIYHMGAAFQWDMPLQQARKTSVGGTQSLMALASNLPNLKRLVHLSGYMLAAKENWQLLGLDPDKQDATQPLSQNQIKQLYAKMGAYEAAKIESHFVIQRLAHQHDIPLTGIMLSSTIGHSESGEMDQPHGIPLLIDQIQAGKFIAIPGTQQDWMPLITVDYLVAFIVGILQLPDTQNNNYVLLDQSTPNFSTLVTWICEGLGRKPPRYHIPKWFMQKSLNLGLGKLMGISGEALDFLQPYQFDTSSADEVAQRLGITKPDIRRAVDHMVSYWVQNQRAFAGTSSLGSLQ